MILFCCLRFSHSFYRPFASQMLVVNLWHHFTNIYNIMILHFQHQSWRLFTIAVHIRLRPCYRVCILTYTYMLTQHVLFPFLTYFVRALVTFFSFQYTYTTYMNEVKNRKELVKQIRSNFPIKNWRI